MCSLPWQMILKYIPSTSTVSPYSFSARHASSAEGADLLRIGVNQRRTCCGGALQETMLFTTRHKGLQHRPKERQGGRGSEGGSPGMEVAPPSHQGVHRSAVRGNRHSNEQSVGRHYCRKGVREQTEQQERPTDPLPVVHPDKGGKSQSGGSNRQVRFAGGQSRRGQ